MNTPGQRIKYIRTEGLGKKLNQEEFAATIFLSQSQLSKLENDETETSEQTAFIIEIVHKFRMEWVLNGKGSKIAIIDDLKEEYTSKFKSVDLLFRKMEIYPKSKKSFDSYFKLSEKQRNVVDQIIDCLLEK
ncbi:helix-turn-helix domain-containing protein [Leptospira santarosai]|uniref:helix-turn-helix domain-containing protein n=1 Tax=Leptospira santarosai TaxID=28183 RepID=UPI0002BF482F|nr:helix-turn-helix domain-containing protein [Leptospira santarosai]EMP79688.1 DNA-binding helix-turn-helix protein [Leptospira santarosai str. CBC1531]MDI7158056.1 helix-turn-helix domain-containing protein [Leptospira santarosai]MDI7182909.1 helix-turn-helix domain-containing protein [Leptospira santarosai]MDI7226493.1 helix-turn-helix domain-containing protein [Leptospira santarosai]MDI7237161.1 helix-turn-helix domain-containing protein [Leptospira santarosai]